VAFPAPGEMGWGHGLVTVPHLKASIKRSTFWASPCTRMWDWNFRKASSSSIPEKSISSTTQLQENLEMASVPEEDAPLMSQRVPHPTPRLTPGRHG